MTRDLAEAARAIYFADHPGSNVVWPPRDGEGSSVNEGVRARYLRLASAALASHDAQRGDGAVAWDPLGMCEERDLRMCLDIHARAETPNGVTPTISAVARTALYHLERSRAAPTRSSLERVAREAVRLAEACFGHVSPLPAEDIITRAVEAGREGA